MSGFAVLRPLISGLAATVLRFPLPLCAALLFCATAIADNHDWLPETIDNEFQLRLMTLAVLGFFWTLSARLFSESRAWGHARQFGLSVAGVGLLVLKVFADEPTLHFGNVSMLLLAPGLILLTMAAPFLFRGARSDEFWDFNRAAWLGAALAGLAAFILALGMTSAMWAIEELFGRTIPWRFDEDVWTVAFSLFCPWLALSRVPRRFDAPDAAASPRALSLLIAFVLVPLAIVYAVIVYAYIARILVLWELPQGQVASIVCGYAGFGIATYLAAWPMRDIGPIHVRLFHRFFFHALLPPVLLLTVAVAERVLAYGITEPRYMLSAVAAWMAALTIAFLWKRELSLPVVPAALAVLMVGASFGPWGAADVSLRSQTGRLASILFDSGLLADGQVLASIANDAVTPGDRREAASIVHYLERTGRLHSLAGWFEDGALSPDAGTDDVLAAISGHVDWDFAEESESVDYTADSMMSIDGFDLVANLRQASHRSSTDDEIRTPEGTTLRWSWQTYAELISLQLGSEDEISFDIAELIDRMRDRHGEHWAAIVSGDDMMLEDRIGSYDARLSIRRMEGSIYNGRLSLWDIDLILLLRRSEMTGPSSTDPG